VGNKYLEKIALSFGHAAAVGGGAALGGAIGHYYDKKNSSNSHAKKRAFNAAVTGAILGTLGHNIYKERSLLFNLAPHHTGLDVHLNTFGASPHAKTKEEVVHAYRSAVKKWHPDHRPPEEREEAEENFRKLQDSWDKVKRSKWFNKLASVNPYIAYILAD
jgi:hypothetical protein